MDKDKQIASLNKTNQNLITTFAQMDSLTKELRKSYIENQELTIEYLETISEHCTHVALSELIDILKTRIESMRDNCRNYQ